MIEWQSALGTTLALVVATLAVLGLLFLLLGAARCRRRRLVSGGLELGLGGLLVCGAVILVLVGLNLYTYQRLSSEQHAGWISFRALGEDRFVALLHRDETSDREYTLHGDEWQLDARFLKWRPPATLVGLDARYRLERLSGRYRDVARHGAAPQSAWGLAEERGIDLWSLLGRFGRYLPLVDAYYGSAVYLPMADGAVYEISVSQAGILARPANDEARAAVGRWD